MGLSNLDFAASTFFLDHTDLRFPELVSIAFSGWDLAFFLGYAYLPSRWFPLFACLAALGDNLYWETICMMFWGAIKNITLGIIHISNTKPA
jgi:hypothetical protein